MATNQSQWIERRESPRHPADGLVRLRQAGMLAPPFEGRLLDRGASGFRARHDRLNMPSGQVVEFEFSGSAGMARAVWTRIVNGEAETGFHILAAASGARPI